MDKKIFPVEVARTIAITEEDIGDIICTALSGGINYWACLDNTKEEFDNKPSDVGVDEWTTKILLDGGTVTFVDYDYEYYEEYQLTLEGLLYGIKLYVERGYDRLACFTGEEVDLCNFDAECADVVIQLAIFNDVKIS